MLTLSRLRRGGDTLRFPIKLFDEISPTALVLSHLLPVAALFVAHRVVRPYIAAFVTRKNERMHSRLAEELALHKRESELFVQQMRESNAAIVAAERHRGGLVIVQAWYGVLVAQEGEEGTEGSIVDVTIAVQLLVANSRLVVPGGRSKYNLDGFYDPRPGVAKELRVRYEFRHELHEATVDDFEQLAIPKRSHRLDT